ncbi:Senescence regulator [Melia azedarach]|uniref:Senescence regulator n=1 Tax=Melia azedarach TaxID=155640 RepID=A0ACC1YPN0_MELAZ|nr:Senescence regulator [Melia azedarach]
MENRNGYYRQNSGVWSSFRDGDFEEADVWAVLKQRKDSNCSRVGQSINETGSPLSVQRNLPSATRMIPRTSSSNISSSSNNYSTDESKGVKQQSAPVKIPDWSNISNKKSKTKALKYDYHDDSDDDENRGFVDDAEEDSYDDDDDDDAYDCKVPPHEFIAQRLAKSQISSFSVFEGVGRKLKGRDLSKVRNAVLTKTGFLE